MNESIPGGWSVTRKKPATKTETGQINYIMNLYGWTTWWERVCKHERIKKISISETNQSAKLSLLRHFSSKALVKVV